MLDKICIHTFLTPGFMGWGELFLEGLRFVHGERIHVRIDSRDLSDDQIELLKRIYGNIEVHNRPFDWKALSTDTGVSIETIHEWRRGIERGEVTEKNYLFKIAISVNERYRSMQQVVQEVRAQGYELLLHSDADIYIRKSLGSLFEIMRDHDFSLFIRPNRPHRLAVVGGFLGFNLNDRTSEFMQCWMDQIDAVPFTDRWIGFGQSALWFAIEASRDMNIADLYTVSGAPGLSKKYEPDKELWLGNSKDDGPTKVISIRKFWDDLLSRYPRIPLPVRTIDERIRTSVNRYFVRAKGLLCEITNNTNLQ
jgi:hypothetical protein